MKKIIFATGNQDKMREIREIMADMDMEICSMKEAGISLDIEENGTTFEENAQIKAKAVAACTKDIVLADVSANYLKCSSLSFTYEFGKDLLSKIGFSRLSLSLSGTNLFTLCSKKLKGQTPTQGGFSEIQLSDRPTYSFGLSVSF